MPNLGTLDMDTKQLDRLDAIARAIANGRDDLFAAMSTGERLYVALAANRADLLKLDGYSIVEALDRLDDGWVPALIERWRRGRA